MTAFPSRHWLSYRDVALLMGQGHKRPQAQLKWFKRWAEAESLSIVPIQHSRAPGLYHDAFLEWQAEDSKRRAWAQEQARRARN